LRLLPKAIEEWLEDPDSDMTLHARLFVFWLLMVPPSAIWLPESLPYLVALSVYAVITGHWSSWQAAKGESHVMKCLERIEQNQEEILSLLREAA
jgi:hypothetical protein